MKYARLSITILLAVMALSLSSCKKDKQQNNGIKHPLHLHMQWLFDNDNVKLYIDGVRVYNGYVTTSPLVGLAEAVDVEQPYGSFEMKIVVNDIYTAKRNITFSQDLFVLFTFENNVPAIDTTTTAPGYD
ncbi:hypothetical protein BH09BAC1_BH09BAC1_09940 [soil metagenome]